MMHANAYGYVFAGDYISPEGEVPSTGLPGIDWETCQTMQLPNNWGYNRLVGYRPFNDLLRQLIDVTSKGGNLLLNIGPAADGEILPQARQCLEKFATWMKVNGEAIHGTTASPFESLPFEGRCTQKPGVLYLHLFTWPKDGKLLVPRSPGANRWRMEDCGGRNRHGHEKRVKFPAGQGALVPPDRRRGQACWHTRWRAGDRGISVV